MTNYDEEAIKNWAYSNAEYAPEMEWQLFIFTWDYAKLFLELSADEKCNHRKYFKHMLYFIVGETVRLKEQDIKKDKIQEALKYSEMFTDKDINDWRKNTIDLLRGDMPFIYEEWSQGELLDNESYLQKRAKRNK